MIGSICFGIGIAGTFIVLAHMVSKMEHKHSMAYYTYVVNNGCPPPSVDDCYKLYLVG